jgi:uncharacterized membrane protein YGL010W
MTASLECEPFVDAVAVGDFLQLRPRRVLELAYSVFAALLGVATGMLLGGLLFRIGLTTDEGAAWSGISLGIPIGIVFAIIAFVYCFRRFRASGQPD